MLNAEFNMDEEGKVRLTFTGLLSEPSFLNVALKQYFNLAGHATGISGLNEQIIKSILPK
ncbi:Aldose 1-epimerase [Caligus rogercresseyi]|uniref:Aldose 1-epimerase n=1 Tax=Caligus rogercresseyi TaxID=217165 RepID=A0A7T8JXH4_CALRO|nr:Aldose 1-epimerase [Caligus rogercresseyi]